MSLKFKLKISKNATFEELEMAYKEATGNYNFKLPQEEYDHFIHLNEKEAEEKEKIKGIMGKYYDQLDGKEDNESLKRRAELMDIARFIFFFE